MVADRGLGDVAAGGEVAGADAAAGRELAQDREAGRVGGALEEEHVGVGRDVSFGHCIDRCRYRQVSISTTRRHRQTRRPLVIVPPELRRASSSANASATSRASASHALAACHRVLLPPDARRSRQPRPPPRTRQLLRRPTMTMETIHDEVRARYAAAATQAQSGGCCSGDPETIGAELYSALERAELPDAAVLAIARLRQPDRRRRSPRGRARARPRVRRRHRRAPLGEAGRPDRARDRPRHDRRDARARPAQRGRGRRDERRVPQGPRSRRSRCRPSRSTSSSATA